MDISSNPSHTSMKYLTVFLLATVCIVSSHAEGSDNATLEAQIIALDRQGWDAWKNNDASWFQANTTEQFLSISSDSVSDMTQVVEATLTQCKVESVSLDDFTFVILDANAVLLTYVATQDAVCDGEKSTSHGSRNGELRQARRSMARSDVDAGTLIETHPD